MVKISIYPDMRFVIYLNLFNVFLDVCFYAAQTYGLAASISYDFLRCNAKKQVSTKITSSTLGYRLVCACDQLYSPPV